MARGPVQKSHVLTRPTPARQDAPFPRSRPQAAGRGVHAFYVPKGVTVVSLPSNENAAGGFFQQALIVLGIDAVAYDRTGTVPPLIDQPFQFPGDYGNTKVRDRRVWLRPGQTSLEMDDCLQHSLQGEFILLGVEKRTQ